MKIAFSLLTAMSIAASSPIFAATSLVNNQPLPAKHQTCVEAWKKVFVEGDISGREVVQSSAAVVSSGVIAYGATKASASVGTAAKIALLLGSTAGLIALTNMDAKDQYEAIAIIKKEALVGGGEALSALSDRMLEAGKKTSPEEVANAINSITDIELKSLCTRDNNPVIFGRYVELVMGKLYR